MPAQRIVPSVTSTPGRVTGGRRRCGLPPRLAAGVLALAASGCAGGPQGAVLAQRTAPDGRLLAEVRLTRCGAEWCHSLWVGPPGEAAFVATLDEQVTGVDEISWSRDGARVGFLVDGHQLRLYDARTRAPAGQVHLVPADGPPTSRIARGVTFSENGASLTFDDCPRHHSGCRPGIVALR